jgi:transcriptional regulator with XRE-family HTH domain
LNILLQITAEEMHEITRMREQLNLSQDELATFLQMKRSTLSLVELRRRELNTFQTAKLSRIQLAHLKCWFNLSLGDETPSVIPAPPPTELSQQIKNELTARLNACTREQTRLLEKISQYEASAKTARHKQAVLNLLKQSPLDNADDASFEALWISIQEAEIKKALSQNRRAEIELLKARVAASQAEATYLEQRIVDS